MEVTHGAGDRDVLPPLPVSRATRATAFSRLPTEVITHLDFAYAIEHTITDIPDIMSSQREHVVCGYGISLHPALYRIITTDLHAVLHG